LLWAFPSFLLSFFLANKYAHEHVSLHTCVCWHLDCAQIFRDEVRGKCPPVYEDVCSETKASIFLSMMCIEFSLSWCLNSDPKLHNCLLKLKIELRVAASTHVLGMQDITIGLDTLFLDYFSGMWCTTKTVLICMYYVNDGVLNCIIGLYIQLNVFLELYLLGTPGNGLPWCYDSK